jgi:hypothetical protein
MLVLSTIKTEDMHLRHLLGILKRSAFVNSMRMNDLQAYVGRRVLKHVGRTQAVAFHRRWFIGFNRRGNDLDCERGGSHRACDVVFVRARQFGLSCAAASPASAMGAGPSGPYRPGP